MRKLNLLIALFCLSTPNLVFASSNVEYTNPTQESNPSPDKVAGNEPTTMMSGQHKFGLHGALGVPHPMRIGVLYIHPSEMISAEFNLGRYSLGVQGTSVVFNNLELGLRWHPFKGSFYAGAYLGDRTVTVEKTETISGQNILARAEIKSKYLTPHLGWLWGSDDRGFYSSIDFGLMSPSGASATFSTNADSTIQATQDYRDIDAEVRDQGKKLGELALPLWTLIKVGWIF